MAIKAINKAHQKTVDKAYKHYRKYHALVNQDDTVEPYSRAAERLEDKQAEQFDLFQDAFGYLPKREQDNFNKLHKAIHGYT